MFGDVDRGITPNRRITVTLDDHIPSAQQSPFQLSRSMEEIGAAPHSDIENCMFIKGVGWQLIPKMMKSGGAFEINDGQDDVLTSSSGTLALAAGHAEFKRFKPKSGTGISYTDSPTSGAWAFQKRVPAGSSHDQRLAADQASFPGPTSPSDNTSIDRVAKSTHLHTPGDHVSVSLWFPNKPISSNSTLGQFEFSGGAGKWDNWTGYGIYSVKLLGSSVAELYELGKESELGPDLWKKVFEFDWTDGTKSVSNTFHRIVICTSGRTDSEGNIYGGAISFITGQSPIPGTGIGSGVVEAIVAKALYDLTVRTKNPVYIPQQDEDIAVQPEPFRVSIRRDIRAQVSVARSSYPDEGTIYDGVFSLPRPPVGTVPINIAWFGSLPDDCEVDIQLFDAETNVELTGGTSLVYPLVGGQASYPPPPAPPGGPPQRHFRVKLTLRSSTDKYKTPVITSLVMWRKAEIGAPGIDPLLIEERTAPAPSALVHAISELSITHPGRDSYSANAKLTITDLVGDLVRLANRGTIPVRIDLTYDIDTEFEETTTIFRGHIESPVLVQEGYPYEGGYMPNGIERYQCTCSGMWRVVQEQLTPHNYLWFDYVSGRPSRITDIARDLLEGVWGPDRIDVPDLPVRLWNADLDVIPVGVEVLSYLSDILDGYLGAWMFWDDYAGTNGMYRVKVQTEPPYVPIAAFTSEYVDSIKLSIADGRDPVDHVPSSSVLYPVPIIKGTYSSYTIKPEGNSVTVYGISDKAGKGHISQHAVNTKSFNSYDTDDLDPDNPSTIGREVPIQYYDQGLVGPNAVNWMVRRIVEMACYARKVYTFSAKNQLVMDPLDTLQERARPLRFADPVVYIKPDGTQIDCLVVNNFTTADKAYNMIDTITVMSVDEVSVGSQYRGAIPKLRDAIERSRRIVARMMGVHRLAAPYIISKGRSNFKEVTAVPSIILPPIQDLDPSSGTYGDWL